MAESTPAVERQVSWYATRKAKVLAGVSALTLAVGVKYGSAFGPMEAKADSGVPVDCVADPSPTCVEEPGSTEPVKETTTSTTEAPTTTTTAPTTTTTEATTTTSTTAPEVTTTTEGPHITPEAPAAPATPAAPIQTPEVQDTL